MGEFLEEDAALYHELYCKGRTALETELWNGEYFFQKTRWKGLNAEFPPSQPGLWTARYRSPESLAVMEREGPKYLNGTGCLSDGVVGAWMAQVCGIGEIIDPKLVEQHLLSVYRYNFKESLAYTANPAHSSYASGKEGGLLLCTWLLGGQPTFPFFYAFEVWTGIEYQVASHLCMFGHVDEVLKIVRTCRSRYDGRVRNPFDEFECGHWYARAMSSFALLQGLTGASYDAVEKTLYLDPAISGDFQSSLSVQSGYGLVRIRAGQSFLDVRSGRIEIKKFIYKS